MANILEKLFGSKESNKNEKSIEQKKSCSGLNLNKLIPDPRVAHLDNKRCQQIRLTGMGAQFQKIAMEAHIKAVDEHDPNAEWSKKFSIEAEGVNLIINCNRGLNDPQKMEELLDLWFRRMFVENCLLVGVEKLIFIDKVNNTYEEIILKNLDLSILIQNQK